MPPCNLKGVIMDKIRRCRWCNEKNPRYVEYHDNEWCRPNFSDEYLYEMLILESFQAGLSWECVLNKREAFRKAYDSFDIDKVTAYGDEKISELISNKGIIRHRGKIKASIENSKIYKAIQCEFGSFYNYLKGFTNGITVYETDKTTNELSDAISKDLQKRGMKFVGSTIIYSYLQAIGVIYSHGEECFLHKNVFYGISRDFSLIDEDQYNTIGAFWDEMADIYGLESIVGLGYNWHGNTMSYAIGLKSGVIDGFDASVDLPRDGWENADGKTENLKEIYDKIYTGGALVYEIESFYDDGSCQIKYHRR